MTEYKSVIVVQTNEAGQPTNLLSLEDGDTISDDVLSPEVRGAASAVQGVSATVYDNSTAWAAGIDAGTLADIQSVSGTVKDTSGDLVNASSTFNAFSGDIQLCTVYVSGVVDSNTADIGSLDSRVGVVEGLVPSAAGFANWNTIYGDRDNIIEASGDIKGFVATSGVLAKKDTVAAADIDANAVTETKILDGAVTANKIGSNAVTTTKINNLAVSLAKIQAINSGRILGNNTGVGASPTELTAADVRTLINVEDGATADQTDAEIETAYNNQVIQVTSGEKTAGTETAVRRFSPKDVADMAATHGGGGGGGDFTGSATASAIQVLGASSVPISGTQGETVDPPKSGYNLAIDTAAEKLYWRRPAFQATSVGGITLGGDIDSTANFALEDVEMTMNGGSFTTIDGAVNARKINAGSLGLSSNGPAKFENTITFDDGTALGKILNISNNFGLSAATTYLSLYGPSLLLSSTNDYLIRQSGTTPFNGNMPNALTGGLDAYNKKDSGYYGSFIQLSELGGGQDINQSTTTYVSFDTVDSSAGTATTDFTHNGSDTITINTAGTYEISVNIGVSAGALGTSNQRTNTVVRCDKSGTAFGPTAKTGYIRITTQHEESSHHIATFVTTFTAGQTLKVGSTRETGALGPVHTLGGECFLYVRRII